ncbi:ATP-binding protein [Candidatus Woesearchaeota archaeon]|nr:ATP-binding protein [Candidatus Woesearchaeota archaeon]MBU3942190.1 ATP-binding protein [Nanoarchaeota archaeon]
MYEIIIGRNEKDRKDFGLDGTILLGKHFVKMGQVTSLYNPILLDVIRSHIVFICGKRGCGKSYTLGVIAEGMSNLPEEISKNLSVVILDTMGIYWTMKYANKKDEDLLDEWGLKASGFDVKIFTPIGYYDEFRKKGIPTDFSFSIMPSEFDAADWCMTFEIPINSSMGVLIERVILNLKEKKKNFSIGDIIKEVKADKKVEQNVKDAVENRFVSSEKWGLFSEKGTALTDLILPGKITILDVSCYATLPGSKEISSLVIGLVAQKLFRERMIARRTEEFEAVKSTTTFFEEEIPDKEKKPMVWLMIDEAHEFLPKEGKTSATHALLTILREGRQPGISLVLASQQPGQIHTDVMTQSDTVISHRITAKIDIDALSALMQSYMRKGLDAQLNDLPHVNGAALIFDDTNERMYPMMVRPRITWHGGEAPTAIKKRKKIIDL